MFHERVESYVFRTLKRALIMVKIAYLYDSELLFYPRRQCNSSSNEQSYLLLNFKMANDSKHSCQ